MKRVPPDHNHPENARQMVPVSRGIVGYPPRGIPAKRGFRGMLAPNQKFPPPPGWQLAHSGGGFGSLHDSGQ
jgi:hypothetical protein